MEIIKFICLIINLTLLFILGFIFFVFFIIANVNAVKLLSKCVKQVKIDRNQDFPPDETAICVFTFDLLLLAATIYIGLCL